MEEAYILLIKEDFYFEHSAFKLSNSIAKMINENWKNNLNKNPNLFNGDVICLKKISKHDDKIDFIFNLTDYAHFLASYQNKIPSEFQCRNLHVSALIETSDNFVTFAQMGKNSFDSGRYQFIGGGLDLNFIEKEKINFTKCIRNELIEEIDIDIYKENLVESFNKIYFGITKKQGGLSIIYKVKLKITSIELNKRLAVHNKIISSTDNDCEVVDLFFVNKNNYKEIIANLNKNTNNNLDNNLYSSLRSYFDDDKAYISLII